jgi:drug/metabolite transporter (DMT)-like permease
MNAKSWIKKNKWEILLFIALWTILAYSRSYGIGIELAEAAGFILLFGILNFIVNYNHKNPHKISAFINHNRYLIWIMLGLIYMIAFPFIYVYYHAYIPTDLLIVLSDVVPVVAFIISFTLAILLASYMLRHFRIIYYPKGRRLE